MAFYFDNAATTKMSEKTLELYTSTSSLYFENPSSLYPEGIKAKEINEKARQSIATLLKVSPSSLVFTSGATEGASLFFSSLLLLPASELISSPCEHEAVSSWYKVLEHFGWKITYLKVKNGTINCDDLKEKLNSKVKVVSVMATNNVTGFNFPIADLVKTVREEEKKGTKKILFFSDSVQALGKTNLCLKDSGVDVACFSAHKVNGPKGVGLLYLRNPASFQILSKGGGQENGKRGGTENVSGNVAFSNALTEWYSDESREKRAREIWETLYVELNNLGLKINSINSGSPFILSFVSPLPSEVYMRKLSDKGFLVSSGSACSNNAKGKSEKILSSMGIKSEDAKRTIRVSFDKSTKLSDVKALIEAIKELNGR